MIHPTAIIDSKASIADGVHIGPYAVIGADVDIGPGCRIGAHAVIEPYTTIGPDCVIHPFAAIGGPPQSLQFKGEKSVVTIGRGTVIREFVTIHRGTGFGGGVTSIGENNYLMAYSHIAHDCHTGKKVILANNATFAGHITIGDHATVGGLVAIHQFVRIGDYAFIGGTAAVTKDIPPYVMAAGDRARLHGLNTVGLKRNGFSAESLNALKKAYRIIFRIGLTMKEAIQRVRAEVEPIPEVVNLVAFILESERGVTR
jgi:UDP-N-acetylglucosamine acyltransferase